MGDEPSPKSTIMTVTNDHVDRLFNKWKLMFNKDYCLELMGKLSERVENFYSDLLAESNEKEQLIKDDINALLSEAADVKRLLHKSLELGEKPEDMPLDVWQQTLDKSIEHLRQELRERRAEICELLLQQDQLCEELGEVPLPLLADPLPKPEEMSSFCKHLEHLRAERTRRLEELYQLRSNIKEDMKVLGLFPSSAADEHLLSQANQDLTPDILEKLRFMRKEYGDQVEELRRKIDDMREKIQVLWERLHEKDEFAMRRVREAKEYNQTTYDVLTEELHRCQALRRQNLKTFIEQLRVEIKKWWDLTLKSEKERKRFSNFYNEWYNEDLLELHELELEDLKSYYNTNKEIFDLFAKRNELWARTEALLANTNDPNRFNNRGGQLLKEERERRAITNKLPKIELQITNLALDYEKRNKAPFLVYGEDILELMTKDWEHLRYGKGSQSSARKQGVVAPSSNGKMLPPAPGTTVPRTPLSLRNMSAMSASTMSLRKTPSNLQLSRGNSAAKSTGNLNKRKLVHCTENNSREEPPTAKRSLMKLLNTLKTSAAPRKPFQRMPNPKQTPGKSPLKKVLFLENSLRCRSSMDRRSAGQSGRKRRSKGNSPVIHIHPPSSDEPESEHDEYNKFEPPVRSSELPRTLIAGRSANTRLHSKVKELAQKESDNHQQVALPEPRRSRMWQPKPKK